MSDNRPGLPGAAWQARLCLDVLHREVTAGGRRVSSVGGQPLVVLRLVQQPQEQLPDPRAGSPQPLPLVVEAQQPLRHGQADQPGVGHLRRLARPGPGRAGRGDNAVGRLDVECGQKSVQVGDHDDFPRSDVCRHADLGHSSPVHEPGSCMHRRAGIYLDRGFPPPATPGRSAPARLPRPSQLADLAAAQDGRIWPAVVLIAIEAAPAPNEGGHCRRVTGRALHRA